MAATDKDWAYRDAYGRRASEFGIVVWSPDGKSVAAAGGKDLYGGAGDAIYSSLVASDNHLAQAFNKQTSTQNSFPGSFD